MGSPGYQMKYYPYRTIAILSIVLLIPADMYFLASLTQAASLQGTLVAHPGMVLRLAKAFVPFLLLGVGLHYLWLLALLNSCQIWIEDGWLKRTYRPLYPHFTVSVPLEDIQSLFIERQLHQTRRGSAVQHSLKLQRRSGKIVTLLGGSARPSLLKSVQSAIEKHLDNPGPWRLPIDDDE